MPGGGLPAGRGRKQEGQAACGRQASARMSRPLHWLLTRSCCASAVCLHDAMPARRRRWTHPAAQQQAAMLLGFVQPVLATVCVQRTAVRTGPGRRPAPALIALLISISDSATRCIHCRSTRRSIFQLRIRTQPAGAETPRCAGLLSMRRSPACLNDRMVQWLMILQSRHLTVDVRRSCCRSVDSVATAMARPEL